MLSNPTQLLICMHPFLLCEYHRKKKLMHASSLCVCLVRNLPANPLPDCFFPTEIEKPTSSHTTNRGGGGKLGPKLILDADPDLIMSMFSKYTKKFF